MTESNPLLSLHVRQPLATDTVSPEHIYSLIGEDGITRLVAAFYRQVPADDLLASMYPQDGLREAEARLRDFLIFRFGGPPHYLRQRGHPRLRMRHAPFAIDAHARDRWLALMHNAITQAAIPELVATALRTFFHDTATFLINRESPPG